MNKPTTATAMFAAVLLAAITIGCQNDGSSSGAEAAPNSAKPVAAPTATPSATSSTKIKSGAAPLNYLLGPGGPMHIVDTTTGKTVVKPLVAAPNAIIIIDEAKGISISNTVVKPGPLPAGHQYDIWLDQK